MKEYVILDKNTGRLFVLCFEHSTWNGALYWYSSKLNFDKVKYIELINKNNWIYLGEL